MKKLLFMVGVALFLPVAAMAQDTPKVQVFGGYSYFRADMGVSENLNGWNGAATVSLNKWLGVTADFSGHCCGSQTIGGLDTFTMSKTSIHSYTFGPTASLRNSSKFTPFAHALFGGAHFKSTVRFGVVSGPVSTTTVTDNVIAMNLGGGVDYKITDKFSARLVQADYAYERPSRTDHNNLRLSFGLVFNVGKR
jgi:opacity protein-like surface antigen